MTEASSSFSHLLGDESIFTKSITPFCTLKNLMNCSAASKGLQTASQVQAVAEILQGRDIELPDEQRRSWSSTLAAVVSSTPYTPPDCRPPSRPSCLESFRPRLYIIRAKVPDMLELLGFMMYCHNGQQENEWYSSPISPEEELLCPRVSFSCKPNLDAPNSAMQCRGCSTC